MPSGYTTATPTAVVPDVAVLYRDISSTSTPIGLSKGGLTFESNVDWHNVEFDGKRSKIEGLDRKVFVDGKITGSILEWTTVNVQNVLEPGSSSATATTSGTVITVTPHAASTFLTAATHYLSNVKLVWTRSDGKLISVVFAKALCTKWTPKATDKDEAVIDIEIEARLDATAAASSTDTCPYVILVGP